MAAVGGRGPLRAPLSKRDLADATNRPPVQLNSHSNGGHMNCIGKLCFFPLDPNGPKIFGFAEYIAALALIVLAWTTVDYRYRFHVHTSSVDVRRLAFYSVAGIGTLTILTDLWRASGWLVPEIGFLTPAMWQAILGACFLAMFLFWTSTAFLVPPIFNRRNAERFIEIIYKEVKQGDRSKIAQMADAVARSAPAIVQMSQQYQKNKDDRVLAKRFDAGGRALELLADPRVCSVIVSSAPALLDSIFEELRRSPHESRGAYTLVCNVLSAAITEEASFLYHEIADWQLGPAAASQPITTLIFGNTELLDRMQGVFRTGSTLNWKNTHWQAYLRAASQVVSSYAEDVLPNRFRHSPTLQDIFNELRDAPAMLGIGQPAGLERNTDAVLTLRALINFIQQTCKSLGQTKISASDWSGLSQHLNPIQQIAEVAYKILLASSRVRTPIETAWYVQHNIAWSGIFDSFTSGPGDEVMHEVRERLVRMIWISIRELDYSPNYVGTQMLGLCVNLGLVGDRRIPSASANSSPQDALARIVTRWTRRRFAWLHKYHPSLATAGFPDGVTYNKQKRSISKEFSVSAFQAKPTFKLFQVEPAPRGDPESHRKTTRPPTFSPANNRRQIPDRPWF